MFTRCVATCHSLYTRTVDSKTGTVSARRNNDVCHFGRPYLSQPWVSVLAQRLHELSSFVGYHLDRNTIRRTRCRDDCFARRSVSRDGRPSCSGGTRGELASTPR